MKSIVAMTLLASIVAAEVPSHSYLPPPPRGYPQATTPPSVIAARTLHLNPEHIIDHHNPDHVEHHTGDHGVAAVRSSTQPQEYPTTPIPQARFGDDQGYDNSGYRNGLEDVNTTVNYDSEDQGYPKAYETTGDFTRSGYNDNANNFRSTDSYNQDGHSGYQGNGQNGAPYGVTDQNGGRYQQNQNGRSARSNFN